MIQSGLASTEPLTGVSIQSALPLSLRGSAAAMTNLVNPTRYNLLGVPNNTAGNLKADQAIYAADQFPFSSKLNRDLLELQYQNLTDTLAIFAGIDFSETGNTFTRRRAHRQRRSLLPFPHAKPEKRWRVPSIAGTMTPTNMWWTPAPTVFLAI